MSSGGFDGPAAPPMRVTKFVAKSANAIHHGNGSTEDRFYRVF